MGNALDGTSLRVGWNKITVPLPGELWGEFGHKGSLLSAVNLGATGSMNKKSNSALGFLPVSSGF